jgi:hypothetical protein
VSGALLTTLEKVRERFIHTSGRTDNRSRSPRFTASSLWDNVGKGSRQIRSVTLGKGLALRAGQGGSALRSLSPSLKLWTGVRSGLWIQQGGGERSGMVAGPFGDLSPLPLALNSQLRTDADKGNPTV